MTGTTPQQFANLIDRAIREGLKARRHHSNPHLALVSSSQNPKAWYRVTRTHCTCPSHRRFGVCKHRALILELVDSGRLPFIGKCAPVEVTAVVVGEVIRARVTA